MNSNDNLLTLATDAAPWLSITAYLCRTMRCLHETDLRSKEAKEETQEALQAYSLHMIPAPLRAIITLPAILLLFAILLPLVLFEAITGKSSDSYYPS